MTERSKKSLCGLYLRRFFVTYFLRRDSLKSQAVKLLDKLGRFFTADSFHIGSWYKEHFSPAFTHLEIIREPPGL